MEYSRLLPGFWFLKVGKFGQGKTKDEKNDGEICSLLDRSDIKPLFSPL